MTNNKSDFGIVTPSMIASLTSLSIDGLAGTIFERYSLNKARYSIRCPSKHTKMMFVLYLFYSGTSIKNGFFKRNTTCSSPKRMTKLSSKSEFSWSFMLLEYNWRSNVTIVEEPVAMELFTF